MSDDADDVVPQIVDRGLSVDPWHRYWIEGDGFLIGTWSPEHALRIWKKWYGKP